tara:strand:+ start:1013 stop:1249 length:237 start_codon:yes stop_codon:yes gene_type:complete
MKVEEFLELSPDQEVVFRKWARENYKALDPIKEVWHSSVQDECEKMNQEFKITYEQRLAAKLGVNYTKQRVQKWEETK